MGQPVYETKLNKNSLFDSSKELNKNRLDQNLKLQMQVWQNYKTNLITAENEGFGNIKVDWNRKNPSWLYNEVKNLVNCKRKAYEEFRSRKTA